MAAAARTQRRLAVGAPPGAPALFCRADAGPAGARARAPSRLHIAEHLWHSFPGPWGFIMKQGAISRQDEFRKVFLSVPLNRRRR